MRGGDNILKSISRARRVFKPLTQDFMYIWSTRGKVSLLPLTCTAENHPVTKLTIKFKTQNDGKETACKIYFSIITSETDYAANFLSCLP